MVLSIIAYSLSASAARCWKIRSQNSRLRPPAEAPVHVLPIPEAFRQIAPGYPGPIAVQHRFDEPPVVDRGHANPTLAPGKQVPDAVPLIIAKSVAAHRSAPEADRLRIGKPAAPESAICRQRDDCSGSVAFRTQSPQCAHDDPPVQEAQSPRSALEERIGEAYEEVRALHEAGEIEWSQLSPQLAYEMAFLDD